MRTAYHSLAVTTLIAYVASATATFAMNTERSTAQTAHYRLELDLGHSEEMYSKADAKRLEPSGGEIMVGGKMVGGMGAMHGKTMNGASKPAPSVHHLELHVRSKTTGKAVRNAKVSISLTGPSLKQPIHVPIAVMYGIAEGTSDWHYGNNVMLAPGKYKVLVSANGERARFDLTVPNN